MSLVKIIPIDGALPSTHQVPRGWIVEENLILPFDGGESTARSAGQNIHSSRDNIGTAGNGSRELEKPNVHSEAAPCECTGIHQQRVLGGRELHQTEHVALKGAHRQYTSP